MRRKREKSVAAVAPVALVLHRHQRLRVNLRSLSHLENIGHPGDLIATTA